jgi:hypothetical protein
MMRSFFKISLLLPAILSFAPEAAGRPRACAATTGGKGIAGKAVYFITNDQKNAVGALPIGADGMLSNGTLTSTGGAGSNAVDGSNNQPAVPDALVSQSALTIAGNVCPRP